MSEPPTHDYTHEKRKRGVWAVLSHSPDFTMLDASGWGHGINVGDYLIVNQARREVSRYLGKDQPEQPTTRYRVEQINYMSDPPDQWFATLIFDPRPMRSEGRVDRRI